MNPQLRAEAVLQALNPYIWRQPCPMCGGGVKFFFGHRTAAENLKWLQATGNQAPDSDYVLATSNHIGRHFICSSCQWLAYDTSFDDRYERLSVRYLCPLCCNTQ